MNLLTLNAILDDCPEKIFSVTDMDRFVHDITSLLHLDYDGSDNCPFDEFTDADLEKMANYEITDLRYVISSYISMDVANALLWAYDHDYQP